MSVVVAIKDDNKVWMACDSQATVGYSKLTMTNPNNYKIVRPENEVNTLVGIVGDAKLANAMKIQDYFIDELTKLKDEFDFKYVVKTLVPKIFSIAKEYEVAEKVKDQNEYSINGALLFAHKNKIFYIYSNGCVIEVDDYAATGSGGNLSMGYLNQHNDEDKKEAIIKAVKSSCQTDLYVNYPIIVMNTMDDEVIVIEK